MNLKMIEEEKINNDKEFFIRSTKIRINKTNKTKLETLLKIQKEYSDVVIKFINILWDQSSIQNNSIPSLLPSTITKQIDSWLSARLIQCAGKQASAIVRGVLQKQKKRMFIYKQLVTENKMQEANVLLGIINNVNVNKPIIKDTIPMELDQRFVKFDFNNQTKFDCWLTVASIGNKLKISIPFNKTKHFNKFFNNSKMLSSIRVNKEYITLIFKILKSKNININKQESIGIDVGIKNVISCSNGFQSTKDAHGHDLESIQKKLARKQKASKAFRKAQEHRKNFINWSINQLNLQNIKSINLEKIKNLRFKKNVSRFMKAWTYKSIFDKLKRKCEEQNVSIFYVDSAFTSQRCFSCGWVSNKNRNGKLFKCIKCKFATDADLNASRNISCDFSETEKLRLLKQNNKIGFYLIAKGQEFIVPDAHKE